MDRRQFTKALGLLPFLGATAITAAITTQPPHVFHTEISKPIRAHGRYRIITLGAWKGFVKLEIRERDGSWANYRVWLKRDYSENIYHRGSTITEPIDDVEELRLNLTGVEYGDIEAYIITEDAETGLNRVRKASVGLYDRTR